MKNFKYDSNETKKKGLSDIKELLKGIQKRFDRRNQKFKYGSDVLKPFLKKEKRIRELMEKIMVLLKNEKTDRARQKLFTNQLVLKNGLREAYDIAININKSIEKEKTKKEIKLDIFKEELGKLITLYEECFGGEFPQKENLKNARKLENFCSNLKTANDKIKPKLETKIKVIELNKKSDLLHLYKFIELYNSFIKEVDCQLGDNKIKEIVNKNITNKIIHPELLKIYENTKKILGKFNGLEIKNDDNTKNNLEEILNYANINLFNRNINTAKLEDGNYKNKIIEIYNSLEKMNEHLVGANSCIKSTNTEKIEKTKQEKEDTIKCAKYVKTKIENLLDKSNIEEVN